MKKLTKEAAINYLLEGGIDCPYCNARDAMRHNESDLENQCLVYRCCECGGEVTEYYKVYGVSDESNLGDPFTIDPFEDVVKFSEKSTEYSPSWRRRD